MKILLYNLYFSRFYSIYDVLRIGELNDYSEKICFTTRKEEIKKADVVVFNLPHLSFHLCEEITKQPGQIWVAWNMECEKNYPWILSNEIQSLIDIWMDYHPDSDIPIPYLNDTFIDKLRLAEPAPQPHKNICMFISSTMNNSRRIEYIEKLMQFLKNYSENRKILFVRK